MSDFPILDEIALHGLIGEVVATLDPHTEASHVGLALDLLVSLGNLIGNTPHAYADGSDHHARLNALFVGNSGSGRKGTIRSNIDRIVRHVDPEWHAGRNMGGIASGEGFVAAVGDPLEDESGKLLSGGRDRRALWVEPEFARLLTVAGREGNTTSHLIRQAYDSGTMRVQTRKEPLRATNTHCSIIGHITQTELREKLTRNDMANGFANRFMFACVARTKLLPSGGNLDEGEFSRLGRLFRPVVEEARKTYLVRRTQEAEKVWALMYEELAEREEEGVVGVLTARAEVQILRLSLLYALLDMKKEIDVIHLHAAHAMWKYSRDSVIYLFGDVKSATPASDANRLYTELLARGERGMSGTEQMSFFGRHRNKSEMDAIREDLSSTEGVVTEYLPTAGRPRIHTWASSSPFEASVWASKAKEANQASKAKEAS